MEYLPLVFVAFPAFELVHSAWTVYRNEKR
jgi:hypothetical protein